MMSQFMAVSAEHICLTLVNPMSRLGARRPEHRHAIALVPRGTQACQVVDRRPKSEERVDRMR